MQMDEIGPSKESVAKQVMVQDTKKEENFHEITDLPSKYRLYPKGTKIFARPLKVLEVKALASINEDNANYIINDTLSKTIQGITIDDLVVADKLYLVFWLRANTYRESGYVVDFYCRHCESESTYEFNLDCLNINSIKDDYSIDEIITLSNGDEVKFRQLTVKEEKNVLEFLGKHKKSLSKFDDEVLGISNLITTINGEALSMMRKYEYLTSTIMPGDYVKLESYISHNEIGVDPGMDVTCDKCGGTALVAVTFRSDFFLPKFKSK